MVIGTSGTYKHWVWGLSKCNSFAIGKLESSSRKLITFYGLLV